MYKKVAQFMLIFFFVCFKLFFLRERERHVFFVLRRSAICRTRIILVMVHKANLWNSRYFGIQDIVEFKIFYFSC